MKKNKTILRTLTNRSFRQNKGRNLVAVLAILVTAMMFTALFTLTQSMAQNMTEMYLRQSGYKAHASTKYITDEQIRTISAHPEVVGWGRSVVAGVAVDERLAGRQVEIRCADDQYAENTFSRPAAGKLPQSADEIALDTLTLERLGIPPELGQRVTLEWRKDIASTETLTGVFTLCGWWETNLSAYASMAWVSEDFVMEACGGAEGPADGEICGLRMMQLTFADGRDTGETLGRVLSDCGLTELEFQENLAYTQELQQSVFREVLPLYLGMIVVFAAGYLIIFNVFQISVASDIPFYGRLKTLGAATRQIRKIVYGQGNRLSLMGIPAGLIAGYLLGIILMPVLLGAVDTKTTVSANPVIFLGSALFAYLTVMISCLLPARLAGKVSPMEALRYTDGDRGSGRKSRKSKNGAKIYTMAWANLWRNRKRTVMVICSLTLGMVLMSFFYAKNVSFDVEKYLMDMAVADYQIDDAANMNAEGYGSGSGTISRELLSDIEGLDNLEADGRLYYHEIPGVLSETACKNFSSFYNQERLDEFASYDPTFPEWKKVFDRAVRGEEITFSIYGADGLILDAAVNDQYILDGAYDAEKFAGGQYVLAIGPATDPGSGLPTYSVGEKLRIEGKEFTVMAILAPLDPMVRGKNAVFQVQFILPADTFQDVWPDSSPRKFYFNVSDESMEEALELLENYKNTSASGMNITSRGLMAEQYKAQTRASSVTGYAISLIIALVGVLNFINSMVTAIISRRHEFAVIQSIGMTKRQLRAMLVFEGLYYAGLTLTASYVLGAATVGVIVRAISSSGFSTFRFTLLPLVICTPVLLALAVLIPYLAFRNLEKRSIVERLRTAD